jgi:hypothetical protein
LRAWPQISPRGFPWYPSEGDGEYRFVDSVEVVRREGGTMVYIDFSQLATTDIDTVPPNRIRGITRVVMLPALAKRLIEQLSALGSSDGA